MKLPYHTHIHHLLQLNHDIGETKKIQRHIQAVRMKENTQVACQENEKCFKGNDRCNAEEEEEAANSRVSTNKHILQACV